MVLGTCTRNVGPALTTLIGVAGAPDGAITMCALAAALGGILSGYGAAAVLKRFIAPASQPAAPQAAGILHGVHAGGDRADIADTCTRR